MNRLRVALTAALCLSVPAVAAAQKGDGKDAKKPVVAPVDEPAPDAGDAGGKGEGTDVEMEEDAPPEDMEGTSENPDAPRLGDDTRPAQDVAPPVVRTGYPIEEVLRPLTLPAVTSEIGLDVRATFDKLDVGFGLRARYGITRQAQLGVRYDIGGLYDDGSGSTGFNTGKAVGLDLTYLIQDWVAARLTVPAYFQPFAIAMTLGAPMKFRFGGKLAIVALDDFLDIRLHRFIPSLTDERANEGLVAADAAHTTTPTTVIHVRAGVEYQSSSQLAIKGGFVQSFPTGQSDTFTSAENAFGLEGAVQYSPSSKFDVTGRIGVDKFDDFTKTFGVIVAAAYRI